MPQIMFGAYRPDVASILTDGTSYVHNVIPSPSGYAPIRDIDAIIDALPARCLGFYSMLDKDNTAHLFAGTATKLYKADATNRTWTDVTRLSGGNYAVQDRQYWSFASFGSNVVAVTDANDPQVFDVTSDTEFSALAGSPPQARAVAVVGDFLVLIGLTSEPNAIHWSAINDITGWTIGTASSDKQTFPDGGDVHGLSGGEFGVVFQRGAIRRMIFNPSSATIFDFSRISENRGLFMPYSLVEVHQINYFLSADGFCKIDPAGSVVQIGENAVNLTFLEDADLSNPRNIIGAADPRSTRIYWAYKSNGNSNAGYLDKLLIYDWARNQFTPGTISTEYLGQTTPLGTTLESLDSLGTLDALPYSLDLYTETPVFSLTGVNTAHEIGCFTGNTLEATLDLPEASIGGQKRMIVMSAAPISDAPTAYISIGKRGALKSAKTYSTEKAIDSRGYAHPRVSGRFMTGRLRIPAGTEWTWARGVDSDVIQGGSR